MTMTERLYLLNFLKGQYAIFHIILGERLMKKITCTYTVENKFLGYDAFGHKMMH